MKKLFAALVALTLTLGCAAAENAGYQPGTYVGVSENGKGGTVRVEVQFGADAIEAIAVLEHNETPGLADPALDGIPTDVVRYQSLAVDTVTGATITSTALLEAIADAVSRAGGDVEALKQVRIEREQRGGEEELHAAVVVVGYGAAGLAAAMTAADEGAESVILLEKQQTIGGNAIVSGGYCEITDERLFPENNAGYTAAMEALLSAGPQNDGEAAVWAELQADYDAHLASGSTKVYDSTLYHAIDMARLEGAEFDGTEFPDYLEDFVTWFTDRTGAEWNPTAGIVGYTWPRWSSLKGYYSGQGYFAYFRQWMEKTGANIVVYTGTPMTDILFDENGRAIGVEAVSLDGTRYHVYADKGVILTTGGYAANRAMVKETDGIWGELIDENIITTNAFGAMGDGIVIAQRYGAGVALMENTMLFPLANIHTGSTESIVGQTASLLIVNREGQRFCDETMDRYTISGAMLAQTDGMGFVISSRENCRNTADSKTEGGEDLETLIRHGELYRADSLEALAELAGIDREGLLATVAAYNEMCATYSDPDFGRTTFEADSAIGEGPYFAYPCVPATHITIGGLLVDDDGCVLTEDLQRMEGLYAAGEITVGNCGIDGSFAYGRAVAKDLMAK